ncbi:MAG: hypothetical protein AB1925_08130 [Actinomycetota bacterium]
MGPRARSAVAACLAAGGVWAGVGLAATAAAEPADAASPATSDERTEDRSETGRTPSVTRAADEPPARTDIGKKWRRPDRVVHRRDREPADPCCEDGGKECGPGWPWPWPRPDEPEPPGVPTPSEGHGGVSDRPRVAPRPGGLGGPGLGTARPPVETPFDPDVIDVVPGVGLPATGAGAPITLPVLAAPAPAAMAGAGGGGPGAVGGPAAPRQIVSEAPPARQGSPVENFLAGSPPPSPIRVGYGETLRTAGTSQLAALALPGVVGILVLTAAGGFVGYRQAKAGQAVRARGTARFMN